MAPLRKMKLGSQGLEVSAQGLGCMGMSVNYGPPKPEPDMIALIHYAINNGVTFLDTSDAYADNEILIGKALKGGMRERVELASKFGVAQVRPKMEIRGDPAYVRAACESSLKRLDTDCIDLYYVHRIDTRVPIEVTDKNKKSPAQLLGSEVFGIINFGGEEENENQAEEEYSDNEIDVEAAQLLGSELFAIINFGGEEENENQAEEEYSDNEIDVEEEG